MGFTDNIRDFIINQGRKLHSDLKQFAAQPVLLKVSGLNLQVPGQQVMNEEMIQFPGVDGSNLRDVIPQELDIDIDVTEFKRRDISVVRKQLTEALGVVSNPQLQMQMAQEGKRLKVTELVKDLLGSFDTISNAEKYIEDIPKPVIPGMPGAPGMPGMPGVPQGAPDVDNIEQGAVNPL
jgi:hypothetical protein